MKLFLWRWNTLLAFGALLPLGPPLNILAANQRESIRALCVCVCAFELALLVDWQVRV